MPISDRDPRKGIRSHGIVLYLDHRLGDLSQLICRKFKYPGIACLVMMLLALVIALVGVFFSIDWLKYPATTMGIVAFIGGLTAYEKPVPG